LRNEFDKLYATLSKKADKHIAVIEALAKKGTGLERGALLKAAKLPNGGNATILLRELEESHLSHFYHNTWLDPKRPCSVVRAAIFDDGGAVFVKQKI
jgi:hypothetical protein